MAVPKRAEQDDEPRHEELSRRPKPDAGAPTPAYAPRQAVPCRCGSPYFACVNPVQFFQTPEGLDVVPVQYTTVPTLGYTCCGCGDHVTLQQLHERVQGAGR